MAEAVAPKAPSAMPPILEGELVKSDAPVLAARRTDADLAKAINLALSTMVSSFRSSVRHAMDAGDLLQEAKERVGHGYFEAWLRDCCRLSYRTANRYINLAKHRKEIETKIATVADLNLADAYALIGKGNKKVSPQQRPSNIESLKRQLNERLLELGPDQAEAVLNDLIAELQKTVKTMRAGAKSVKAA